MTTFTIFSDATTTASSSIDFSGYLDNRFNRTFQAFGSTTAGAGAATILVEGSNDNSHWITLGTISLILGVTVVTDGYSSTNSPWKYIRGRISAISGTGAKVSLIGSV